MSGSNPAMTLNKKILSSNPYMRSTQFHINIYITKLMEELSSKSLVPLENMNLFVWKINDGESMERSNKFSIILEDNIKYILQTNHKVNVFDLEKISSKHYKTLMKKMHIKYILLGVFHKFRDEVSLNIRIMTTKSSKIVASSSIAFRKSFYERVVNMDYVGEDTNDDYFMKLKGSK
jgi:TolB-like protein